MNPHISSPRNGVVLALLGAMVGGTGGAALEGMIGLASLRGDTLMPVIVLPSIVFGVYAGAAIAGAFNGCSDYGLFIGGFAGFFLGLLLGQLIPGALLLPTFGAAFGVLAAKLLFSSKQGKML